MKQNILTPDFYLRETSLVARDLLGKVLTLNRNGNLLSGRIVETEAYRPEGDFASHSAVGKTDRNAPMFSTGGILYVYLIYGIHHCINVVTEPGGRGAAVLIRALEPMEGINIMKANRNSDDERILCKGPGNTAKAFGFTKEDNFISFNSEELFILDSPTVNNKEIISGPRIGVRKSADLLLRFYIKNCPFVSGNGK